MYMYLHVNQKSDDDDDDDDKQTTMLYQNKMYRLYRKMTIYGHFSIKSIYFWNPSSNHVISKIVL